MPKPQKELLRRVRKRRTRDLTRLQRKARRQLRVVRVMFKVIMRDQTKALSGKADMECSRSRTSLFKT